MHRRLAQHVVQEARLDRNDPALQLVGHAPEVAERHRGPWHVQAARIAQRVSGIEALQLRQLLRVGLDGVGQLEQQTAAVHRGEPGPGGERTAGRLDGTIDV